MKTVLKSLTSSSRPLGGIAGMAVLLMAGALAPSAPARPFDSPVGMWDCVLSGNRTGTGYIEFLDDGTFDGFEIIVPNNTAPPGFGSGRITPSERGDTLQPPNSKGAQVFGVQFVTGPWFFDI